MSFQMIAILDSRPEGILAKVSHQDHPVAAVVASKRTDDLVAGKSIEAEIGYDEILASQVIPDFDDMKSGIWQEQDGIHLLGRVHNVLDYGDGKVIVEVYLQNGSELFAVDSETSADVPEANDGLEITVGKLYLYPQE